MKATELRIGNYILDTLEEGGVFQVEEIRKDDEGYKGYYIKFRNGSFSVSLEEDYEDEDKLIQGVPLTEGWIKKFGFDIGSDLHGECYFKDEFEDNEFVIYIADNDLCYYDGVRTIIISTVHQLQNLYYALTGKELQAL